MYILGNNTGVLLDKEYFDKYKDKKKEVLDKYLEICEAIVDEDIEVLQREIPDKHIKFIISGIKTKTNFIKEIEEKEIKYYGIELLETKIELSKNKATLKSTNKVRVKIHEYSGIWVVDSFIKVEKENDKLVVKEILI